jgi:hypothetical protein
MAVAQHLEGIITLAAVHDIITAVAAYRVIVVGADDGIIALARIDQFDVAELGAG